MAIEEKTLTVDIPAAELPKGFAIPAAPKEPAAPKPAPVAKQAPQADPRDEEIRQAREALQREQAERARVQRELDDQKSRADKGEDRAVKMEQEAFKRHGQMLYAQGQATYSEHQQVINALGSVKLEMESSKRELEIALNDDNLEPRERARRIADAQERIASAAADQRSLESGKSQLEQRLAEARSAMDSHMRRAPPQVKEPEKKEEPKPPQQEQQQGDPFEKYIGQFPKVVQDWMRDHPEYVKDVKLNKKLIAAASQWDADEKQLHTSEFVAHLDDKFFPKEQPVTDDDGEAEEVDVQEAAPAAPAKAKSAPAAPVSRSAAPATGSDKRSAKVKLTPAEQNHAVELFGPGTNLNLSPEEAVKRYGRNKLHAEADGKYLPRS